MVSAFPFKFPVIGLVTVRFANVPTEVRDENRTAGFRVFPVNVFALAATRISTVPLNTTPFIFLDVCKAEAVAALPVTLPLIGFVTVKLPNVPTEVSDELTTFGASVFPINTFAFVGRSADGVAQLGAAVVPLL